MAEATGVTAGTCPDCGRSWPPAVRFCGACGAAVAADAGDGASGAGTGASAPARARSVLVLVGAVVGVGLLVGMVASIPRASPVEEATFDPGAVGLPPEAPRSAPTSTAAPMAVTAACPQAPRPDCVRWVRPGPQGRWLGAAPVTGGQDSGVLVVGDQDQVRGLDLDTGALLWTAAASGNVVATRGVGDEVVLVQDDAGVRALDLRDGDVRWEVAHAAVLVTAPHGSPVGRALIASHSGDTVTSHELATGDVDWSIRDARRPTTVVPLGEARLLLATSVVDARTGARVHDLDELTTFPRVVAASRDRLLVLEGDGERPVPVLRAAATGEEVARLDLDPDRVRGAVVVRGHVVVHMDDETVAFDLADGAEAWRRRVRGELLETPMAVGPAGRWPGVAVPAPALAVRLTDGTILVLDEATGQVRQRIGQPDPDGINLGGGTVVGSRVFRMDQDQLQVFDLENGDLLVDVALRSPTILRTDPLVVLSERHLIRLDPVVS